MSEKRITQIEEEMAHLTRAVEDLSDIVARMDTENGLLKHRVQMLLQREAERESQGGGGAVLTDQRPPHW
ncbi:MULTISPECIES: SlyX family protein [Falsihalocynthiibacter]|uniref:SlyX family protein n=1 Tax=Falsihalocynthiibacter TaxID=2854182 RepID=UPI0030019E78